jgi:hypothetical protein
VRDLETLPVDAAMIFPPLLFAWGKVEGELKFRFSKISLLAQRCRWCSFRSR